MTLFHRELSIARNREPQGVQRGGRTDVQDVAIGTAETDICDDLWNPDLSQERAVWIIAMDSIKRAGPDAPRRIYSEAIECTRSARREYVTPRQLAIGTDTKYAYVTRTVLYMASPRVSDI